MRRERLLALTRRVLGSPARVVTSLVLLAAMVFGGFQVAELRRHHQREQDRHQVTALAEEQVLDLTTLDSSNVAKKIAAMQERSEGSFKKQLSALATTFTSVITKGGVKSTGAVNAHAIVSQSSTKAEVMVASTAVVAGGKGGPATRTYRFAVDLTKSRGRWLISNMEFVS